MKQRLLVRPGIYRDSVTLLAMSREVGALAGVQAALVAMATPVNTGLAADLGFDVGSAGPNDLLIALRADDAASLTEAELLVDGRLAAQPTAPSGRNLGDLPSRTVRAATRDARNRGLDPIFALVSVAGRHALPEAMDALDEGLDVMIFSDNMPLDQERALKEEGRRRGRLVMGPDCGTVILDGVGIGFANAVRRGPVGVVTASGTGAQQLICLLDAAGAGTSHVLGVGGRDLSTEIGAISTLQALRALEDDPATGLIVVMSKPAPASVAHRVRIAAEQCRTPVLMAILGPGEPTIAERADEVLGLLGLPTRATDSWPRPQPRGKRLVGLFSGGTLCHEALTIARPHLGAVRSNIPAQGIQHIDSSQVGSPGHDHRLIDYGDDELTIGRPHPMIDLTIRVQHLKALARTGIATVALLDVVLGHGAHPDPAGELGPAIVEATRSARAHGSSLAVVVSLTGTDADPQGRDATARTLADAGAAVYCANAAATAAALDLIG